MKLSKRQIYLIGGGVVLALAFVVVILVNLRSGDPGSQKVTLTVWGFEEPRNLQAVFAAYRKTSPNVTVDYKKVSVTGYEDQLLEALALQRGPDVFVLDNNSIIRQREKLAPVDPQVFGLERIKALFPQAVEQDFVSGGRIYGLPYSLDTLALLYNRDFFDEAGIIEPPKTWEAFQSYVSALRRLNDFGAVTRAGAAFGGAKETISQAADIFSLLLMQNKGVVYERESLGVTLNFRTRGEAYKALAFYLQFSDPKSSFYTWSGNQGDSIKSFADKKAAMILGYKEDLEAIKKTNPFLDFGIAPAPQISGDGDVISHPDYLGFVVSKQSKAQTWAWDFIINTATNVSSQREYMRSARKPPALRFLIGEMVNDSEMGVFARQALTARSWLQVDGGKVEEILNEAIANALYNDADYDSVLKKARDEIVKLLGTYKIKVNG